MGISFNREVSHQNIEISYHDREIFRDREESHIIETDTIKIERERSG